MRFPDRKTIHQALCLIHKQSIYGVCQTLAPVSDHLDFIITKFCIIFPDENPYTDYSISEDAVYGSLLKQDYAFLLCDNGVLHIWGCEGREHWLFYVGCWRMREKRFCLWCKSHYRKFILWLRCFD